MKLINQSNGLRNRSDSRDGLTAGGIKLFNHRGTHLATVTTPEEVPKPEGWEFLEFFKARGLALPDLLFALPAYTVEGLDPLNSFIFPNPGLSATPEPTQILGVKYEVYYEGEYYGEFNEIRGVWEKIGVAMNKWEWELLVRMDECWREGYEGRMRKHCMGEYRIVGDIQFTTHTYRFTRSYWY